MERRYAMQATSADETIQRLIFGLSELEQLGETIISGHGNFAMSSMAHLRMILGTLQVTKGAILTFNPADDRLRIESSNLPDESVVISVKPDDIPTILQFPIIDLVNPPLELEPFLKRIQPQLTALSAKFWAPLNIGDELLGVISLGRLFEKEQLDDWDGELLNVLANQTSIAIGYSRLLDERQAERFRLFMLADAAPQICKLLDPKAVEEEAVGQAVSLLDANAGALMLIDPITQRLVMRYLFQFNLELENLSIHLKPDQDLAPALSMLFEVATQGTTSTIKGEDATELFGAANLMAVPIIGRESNIRGVLVVGDKEGRGGTVLDFVDGDGVLLDSFAKQAGVAIENAQLYQEALEGRRLQAEMDEARKIQENLIPDTVPEIPGYEVFGLYHPRGGVGGDYYDYIQESDGSWGLAIADVSGKGMQAALLMATLRAGLLSEVSRQSDLYSMVLTLNSLLYASGTEGKFATFFYAQLQPEAGLLTSINAGHNYPLVVRNDGSSEWLGLEKGSVPLGMFPDDMIPQLSDCDAEATELSSGDVVLFYTDGVTETGNHSDEMYEEERLQDTATRVRHASADEICRNIYNDVMEFQGEAEQFDDLTLMVLKKN